MNDQEVISYLPLAQNLARYIAWMPEDVDDLVQAGMIALLTAARNTEVVRFPNAFADSILRRTIQDQYSIHDRRDTLVQLDEIHGEPACVGKDLLPLRIGGLDEFTAQIEMDEYYAEVGRVLGVQCEHMARELVEPSEGVRWFAMREMTSKMQRRELGEDVRGAGIIRMKREFVRRHLRLQENLWYNNMTKLRRFTSNWLKTDGGIESIQESRR